MENTKEFIEGQDFGIETIAVTMEGITKGIQKWYEIIKKDPEARKVATAFLKPYWESIDWNDEKSVDRGLNTMIYEIASIIFCFDKKSIDDFPVIDLPVDKAPHLSNKDRDKLYIDIDISCLDNCNFIDGYFTEDYDHTKMVRIFTALFRPLSLKTLSNLIAKSVNKEFKTKLKADEIVFPTLEELQDKEGKVCIGDSWVYEPYEFANHHQFDNYFRLIPEHLVTKVLEFFAENEEPDEVLKEYQSHIDLRAEKKVVDQQVDDWYHDDPDIAIREILGVDGFDWYEIDGQSYLMTADD